MSCDVKAPEPLKPNSVTAHLHEFMWNYFERQVTEDMSAELSGRSSRIYYFMGFSTTQVLLKLYYCVLACAITLSLDQKCPIKSTMAHWDEPLTHALDSCCFIPWPSAGIYNNFLVIQVTRLLLMTFKSQIYICSFKPKNKNLRRILSHYKRPITSLLTLWMYQDKTKRYQKSKGFVKFSFCWQKQTTYWIWQCLPHQLQL